MPVANCGESRTQNIAGQLVSSDNDVGTPRQTCCSEMQ